MIDASDEFSDLSPRAAAIVGGAAIVSLVGTLLGLAGLLMWGIKAFDLMFPASGEGPQLFADFAPYLTVFNFVLTVLITVCGVFNLMLATRGREFVEGGWKRWLLFSAISAIAGVLFFAMPSGT